MVAAPPIDARNQHESPDVQLGDRRFPAEWAEPKERPKDRIRKIEATAAQDELPALLAGEIASRLAWAQLPQHMVTSQLLVETYVVSLRELGRFRGDVDQLVVAACRANLEFRQISGATHEQARDEQLQSQVDTMLKEAAGRWLPPTNILNARLVSQPEQVLRQRLDQALHDAVSEFSTKLLQQLASLVDHELMGLVEWLPNNCCSYHFFKRVVLQENDGSSRRVKEARFAEITERDRKTGRQIIGKKTTTVIHGQGKHTLRFARHQHDVMNAVRTSIANSAVVMPPPVVALCQAVPDWLDPFVRVIDGTIFRERIIERDVEVTRWQDVEVYDEPIVGCEPAIIIGPFVLTGWGPREVRAEEARREAVKREEVEAKALHWAHRRYPVTMIIACAVAILAAGLTWQTLRGQASVIVTALMAVAAIGCIWYAAMDFAVARRYSGPLLWAALITGSLGSQFILGLCVIVRFYHYVPWSIDAILMASFLVCHFLSKRYRNFNRT